MAQAFLHHRQNVSSGFGKHHPSGEQASISRAGGEQVGLPQDPQDWPLQPGQQAGDEEDSGRGMFGIWSDRSGFVQRIQGQATAGQRRVDCRNPEGDELRGVNSGMSALDPGNAIA